MPPLSFGPSRRLRRHTEFSRAQRTGRRVATAHFTLLVARQADLGPGRATDGSGPGAPREAPLARLGLVVSRKVGGAVQRNRVKRLCRECFRAWPDLLPRGVDLVVIARPGASSLGANEVRAEWAAAAAALHRRALEALAQGRGPTHVGAAQG